MGAQVHRATLSHHAAGAQPPFERRLHRLKGLPRQPLRRPVLLGVCDVGRQVAMLASHALMRMSDTAEDLSQGATLLDPAVDVMGNVCVDLEVDRAGIHDAGEAHHVLAQPVDVRLDVEIQAVAKHNLLHPGDSLRRTLDVGPVVAVLAARVQMLGRQADLEGHVLRAELLVRLDALVQGLPEIRVVEVQVPSAGGSILMLAPPPAVADMVQRPDDLHPRRRAEGADLPRDFVVGPAGED